MLHFGVRAGRQVSDDQRPVVLPRAVGAGAEEGVELLAEGVCEGVDVDLGADVVEGDLRAKERRRPTSNHHPGLDLFALFFALGSPVLESTALTFAIKIHTTPRLYKNWTRIPVGVRLS